MRACIFGLALAVLFPGCIKGPKKQEVDFLSVRISGDKVELFRHSMISAATKSAGYLRHKATKLQTSTVKTVTKDLAALIKKCKQHPSHMCCVVVADDDTPFSTLRSIRAVCKKGGVGKLYLADGQIDVLAEVKWRSAEAPWWPHLNERLISIGAKVPYKKVAGRNTVELAYAKARRYEVTIMEKDKLVFRGKTYPSLEDIKGDYTGNAAFEFKCDPNVSAADLLEVVRELGPHQTVADRLLAVE